MDHPQDSGTADAAWRSAAPAAIDPLFRKHSSKIAFLRVDRMHLWQTDYSAG
jgi:hypothetical protein